MTAAEQARRLREAAEKLRRAGPLAVRFFESEAARVEALGELDAQSVEAVGMAEILLSDIRKSDA